MYLMQTVSTTPRARPLEGTEQSANMETVGGVSTLQQVRTSGGEDWSDGCRSPLSPGPGFVFPGVLRNTEKEPTEKRKKWSLGGFFRRRKKDVGSESSSQDEGDYNAPRKGFLARRRSRREKRKSRTNRTVGAFDHIVVNPLTQTLKPPVRNEVGSAADEVNGCVRDANINTLLREKDSQQADGARRSRSREPRQGGSVDRLSSRSSRESYQRHARQDSSLSRNSSGGSESLDQGSSSRRGRLGAVKARAEALRDRQRAESSSEEGEFPTSSPLSRFKSDEMLPVSLQRDGSLHRKSRVARTERYIKRLSRDEEGIIKKEAAEIELQRQQRLCKSDAEGSLKLPVNKNKSVPCVNRWAAIPAAYREPSDFEHPKLYMKASSATPSPVHSPLVRPKNIVHYTNSAPPCSQLGYDTSTSTFPPSHSIHYATPVTANSLDRKTPQHYVRALGSSPLLPSNRSAESIPTVGIPRARINDYRQTKQVFEHGKAGRSDREYIEFQQPGQRSLSYDSSINRAMPKCGSPSSGPSPVPDSKDVRMVQFPVARLQASRSLDSRGGNISSGFVAVKNGPPPPPPRDPQRRLLCVSSVQQDPARPMSFACDGNNHNRYPLQQEHQQQANLTTSSVSPFTHLQLLHQGGADSAFSDIPWASNGQRRSNSDNQLATLHFGHNNNMLHPHAYNPTGHSRQSACSPESVNPSCYQNQYSGHGNKFIVRTTPSPDIYNSSPKQSVSIGQQHFQYFADHQPRSRRPIHVQYNVTNVSNSDQPYLSDSQVVIMKPPYQNHEKRHPVQHAMEVWRQKDQEGGVRQRKSVATSPRFSVHPTNRNERSRSNSPRPKELPTGLVSHSDSAFRTAKTTKIRVLPLSIPAVCPADSLSSLSGNSDISSPMQMSSSSKFSPDIPAHESHQSSGAVDSLRRKESLGSHRPLSMVLEKSETSDPPHQHGPIGEASCQKTVEHEHHQQQPSVPNSVHAPPTRRHSRQSSSSSIEAADWISEDAGTSEVHMKKRKSRNLEDALTELEAIYQSLKLGDEDLLDRAERRDLPVPHQKLNDGTPTIASALSPCGVSRGAESDSGYNFGWGSSSFESVLDKVDPPSRKRAPSIRRSGIPDRVMDDMAYRRLHPKDRPGSHYIRNVMSQSGSYLCASPAAAAAEINPEDPPQKPLYASINPEPDVTLDDVVFRNIRHANNTLKVLDPQPPFGIPIGPIAPACNSDYLHAVPTDSYRSMFTPRRMPDVVKDDLAYRNLRKDSLKEPFNFRACSDDMSGILKNTFISSTHSKNDNFLMRKRRAVRSLSANIQSLVNREPLTLCSRNIDQNFEKAQSLSDLPDALQVAQKILEGKEVIGGGSIKLCNLTGSSNERSIDEHGDTSPFTQESRRFCPSPGSSWIERANLTDCGDRLSFLTSTSTETLTDSRANLMQHDSGPNKRSSWQQKLRVFIPPNTVRDHNEDTSVPDDVTATQRPPPPPTPERNSSRLLSEHNKGDIHQRPPPPPTPERSSSRRPSLDQNKILSTLVQTPSSLTPDRESPRQAQDHCRPPVCKLNEISPRNSLAVRSGRSSPQTDLLLPIPDVVPGSPIDERQLEELLTALAREAKATSDKLERELEELGGDTVPNQEEVATVEPILEEEHKRQYTDDPNLRCQVGKKLSQAHEENILQEQTPELQEEHKNENRVHGYQNVQSELEEQQEQDEGQQSSQGPQKHDNEQLYEVCTGYESAPKSVSAEEERVVSKERFGVGDEVPPLCDIQTESLSTKAVASEVLTEDRVTKDGPYIEKISYENRLEQTPPNLIENSKAPVKELSSDSPPEMLESSKDADQEFRLDVIEPSKESAPGNREAHSSNIASDWCDYSDALCKTVRVTSSSPALNHDHEESTAHTHVSVIVSQEQGSTVQEVAETEVTAQFSETFALPVVEHFTQNTATEEHSLPSAKPEFIDQSSAEECKGVATSVEVSNESVANNFDSLSTDHKVAKSCIEGEDLGASASPSAAAAGPSRRSGSGRLSGDAGSVHIKIGRGGLEGPCDDHFYIQARTASQQPACSGHCTAMHSDRRTSSASKAPTFDGIATSGSPDGSVETQRLRVERMAQYKEERRQQLASQYGPRDDSGSSTATPLRRFITRSTGTTPVRNGDDRSGSGSSSNAEQPSPSSIQRVRTTRTSRLRAAVTSATENNAQSGKDASGIPIRNVRNTGPTSPRTAVAKEAKDVIQCVTPCLSGKDVIKESSVLSPRKDILSLARSQSGKDIVRDCPESSLKARDPRDAARPSLSRSHSGKNAIRDLSLSPRCISRDSGSVLSRSQSGKELVSTGLSPKRQSGRELFGLSSRPVSARDVYEGHNPSRSLLSSPRTRVGVTDSLGPTPSTGTTGSSDKEQSPAAMCSDGVATAFPRREKDKSSKRKSNLNRSLATEEVVCSDNALLGGDNRAIRRRRRRAEYPYGVGGVSLHRLDTGLEPVVPESVISPIHSSKSDELSRQSSPFKKATPEFSNHVVRTTPSAAPNTSPSSRSLGDEHQHPTPSRSILRLTADSGTHFLQATRSTSPGVATSKGQISVRSETGKSPSQPLAFPSRIKSSEDDNASPSKMKASAALRVCRDSGGVQPEVRMGSVSQKVEKLMALTRETVARLDRLTCSSPASSKTCDGTDNKGTSALHTSRETNAQHKSGLGESSSTCSTVTVHNAVNKSNIYQGADSAAKKTHGPSTKGNSLSQVDELHSPSINVTSSSSDSSPMKNGSSEIYARTWFGSPKKQPSSILKKKSVDEPYPLVISSSVPQQMPVSILKRKTSQDEARSGSGGSSAPPPPVTFSPSVVDQAGSGGKRQGILKKRSSLDESGVLRRRSCSPDMAAWDHDSLSEFRPILKNQRRSSMEELGRRTQSPDPHPQSILKRRTSREDEVEERISGSPEPQGILKRKSATSSNSSSSSTSPHISIAASVIMNVAGWDPGSEILPLDGGADHVRPILKKKSSSEDNTTADSSSTEAPKPILKKKSSVEVDDAEERPMKPILKSSRKLSQEEQTSWETASMDSPVRCLILRSRGAGGSDSASGSDCEVVRPILKQPGSDRSSRERSTSPRHRLSFCDDQDQQVVKTERCDSMGSGKGSDESRNVSPIREGAIHQRRLKQSSLAKSNSPSSMDNELSVILNKRRSLEVPMPTDVESIQLRRSPIVMETARGQPRPMSVAERILTMENFLCQEMGNTKQTGAVPKKPGSLRASRDRERFHTQPITLHELSASAGLESVRAFQKGVLNKNPTLDNNASLESPVEISRSESKSVPEVNRERHPIWVLHNRDDSEDCVSFTSPPRSPKADLKTHSSTLKSLSPDSADCARITSPPKSPKADLRTHTSPLKSLSPDPGDCARTTSLPKSPKADLKTHSSTLKSLSPDSADCARTSPPKSPKADLRTHTSPLKSLSPDPTMSNDTGSHRDDGSKEPVHAEDFDSLFRLKKSNSVVARVSMFAQLEEDMKRAATEAKTRKLPKAANRSMARREDLLQPGNRFATQPVTMGEVEEAVRSASSRDPDSNLAAGKQMSDDDDEPSHLSLADRVRLFNQKIQDDSTARVLPKQPPPTRRRLTQTARFKTHPVTTEEVESAARRISPLAASLTKPPDPKVLGGMSARAAREKMYEHASAVLAKSSSYSRLFQESDHSGGNRTETNGELEADIKPKGILKSTKDSESHARSPSQTEVASSSDVETESESEVRGILKTAGIPIGLRAGTPESESFHHLKSVLKKETAPRGMCENQAVSSPVVSASNEHLRSILKPEPSDWDESSSSSSDSSSESNTPARPHSAPARNAVDLVSILHGVEATARKQRQALISSPNNKPVRPSSTDEKVMNLRNSRSEKENHQGSKETAHFEKKKVDDNCSLLKKDTKLGFENHHIKKQTELFVDNKSLISQRKLDSKLLVDEINRKGCDAQHVKMDGRPQTFSTSKVSESHIIDHKSMVNQRKLECKKIVDELCSSRKSVMQHSEQTVEEEEAAQYERQLHRQIEELQRLSASPTPPTSDGDTSSSGGREVRRIIRNEAVARRRQAALAKQQKQVKSSRSESLHQEHQLPLKKSESHSAVSSVVSAGNLQAFSRFVQPSTAVTTTCLGAGEDEGFVRGGLRRSFTQPLTVQELRDADEQEVMSGVSIAERLAALQKSGDTDWKKRLTKVNPEDDLTIICSTAQINHHHVSNEIQISAEGEKVSRVTESAAGSGSILADRLGKLDAATQGWKKRVGPTDAVQFSVAGRMMMEHTHTSVLTGGGDITLTPTVPSTPPSPLLGHSPVDGKRRTPRAERFRSRHVLHKEVSSTPSSPHKEMLLPFTRSISAPGGEDDADLSADQDHSHCGPRVVVPQLDDETFTSFFSSNFLLTSKSQSSEELDLCIEDLDHVVSNSRKLLIQKRTVRLQRKAISSRNPLKALAARTDLQDEYIEVRSGIAEKEVKRLKVEKLAKNSSLALEALAGLASKEDFTAVSLKKAASPSNGNMLPYKDVMLLQVKGRRHVQTRLVEPVASSINSGDNYVLVTPTEVYNYVGRYSNVIERARGAEVAISIHQKKDLGCSNSRHVITVSEEKATCSTSQAESFWKLLNGTGPVAGAGHPDEDELFESAIVATNMVYEVQGDELVPVTEYWGTIPKIEMLDPSKILVFDFGSELYVWNGKNAVLDRRRVAVGLAKELWNEGYDYSECDVCPLTAASVLGRRDQLKVIKKGASRPDWALLAKVTQHMETVLFREKFLDWPDFSRVIRTKSGDDEEKQVDASIDVKPCDVQLMVKSSTSDPDLELEGSHVGRGFHYYDSETHRHYEITTLSVSVWHILEYEHTQLQESSVGQFYSGDSYVVRWLYTITVTGRELSGQPSRHAVLGRDRCAYFCWQGQETSLNEQGAAALLTVELDQERGPQVRVVQGMEPPAFLALFKGHMVVHSGRREDGGSQQSDGTWRLYISRGELPQEGVLVEVPCSVRQLRSRASLVLLNTATGAIFVWHGAKTQPHTCKIALAAAQHLKSDRPAEVGFAPDADIFIEELHEGSESSKFFQALGGAGRQLYVSLLHNPKPFNKTSRLFHLSSVSGTFCSTEVYGPYRSSETVTSFPFLQSDLYSASQPALFLLDNAAGNELWLWQGWWPDHQGEETEGCDARGSGAVRWQAERRAAMQTSLDYWHSQHEDKDTPVAYLVWAGLEPLQFTNLFPIWTDRDDIAELNIRDGRKAGEVLKVEEELARLTHSAYPVAQLLQRPLPDGVDPTRLELYVDPQHFQELFGMSKEEFLDLPIWKQKKNKQEVGLF